MTTAVAQQLLSGLLPFGFHVAAKNRLRPDQVAVRDGFLLLEEGLPRPARP